MPSKYFYAATRGWWTAVFSHLKITNPRSFSLFVCRWFSVLFLENRTAFTVKTEFRQNYFYRPLFLAANSAIERNFYRRISSIFLMLRRLQFWVSVVSDCRALIQITYFSPAYFWSLCQLTLNTFSFYFLSNNYHNYIELKYFCWRSLAFPRFSSQAEVSFCDRGLKSHWCLPFSDHNLINLITIFSLEFLLN